MAQPGIWFRFHPSTLNHPKTYRLMHELGVDRLTAVGILAGLWAMANEYYPDGEIRHALHNYIEDRLAWRGTPGACVTALITAGFLDEVGPDHLRLHDFSEHGGGAYQRIKEGNLERQRRLRERRAAKKARPQKGHAEPATQEDKTCHALRNASVTRLEERREEKRRLDLSKELNMERKRMRARDTLSPAHDTASPVQTGSDTETNVSRVTPTHTEEPDPERKLTHLGELRGALSSRPNIPSGGLGPKSQERAERLFPIRECELDRAAEDLLKQGKLPQPAIILCHIESQLRDPKDLSRPHPTRGIAQPVDWDAEVREQEARDALRAARGAAR